MSEIVRMDNGKDNEIMEMMNDASLCPLLEETKVGVSNYTKLPVTRLAAMGTAFQPLTTAVQQMRQLIERQSNFVHPFIDNIDTVNRLNNNPVQLLVDKDNLYIATIA